MDGVDVTELVRQHTFRRTRRRCRWRGGRCGRGWGFFPVNGGGFDSDERAEGEGEHSAGAGERDVGRGETSPGSDRPHRPG